MSASAKTSHAFRSALRRFPGAGAPHYFEVPADVAKAVGGKQGLRLRVSVDGRFSDHLALRRRNGVFFVSAGAAMRKRCRLLLGSEAAITVSHDPSKHGIPLPRPLASVLKHDPDAKRAFERLSPGARRTLITRVRKSRTREGKERCALAIADELAGRPRGSSRLEWRGGVG